MSFRKILCPVDFSPASEVAASYAVSMAQRFDGEVTLLYVAPVFEVGYSMTSPAPDRASQLAEHRNVAVRRALDLFPVAADPGVTIQRQLGEGTPADEIVRVAKQGGFDLIVMPTRGNSALRRWLVLGSVSTRVLHAAECPVITSANFDAPHGSFELYNLLCAVDLGPTTRRVLDTAAALARETGARLTVLHAVPAAGEAMEDFIDDNWRITLKSRMTAKIQEYLDQAGTRAEIVIESGESYKAVPDAARRLSANLVVIGRSTHSGLLGRLRAQAYEIIRRSPSPVLSV